METYTSQEALIMAKAKEKGIGTVELNAVFEKKLKQVTAEYGGRSVSWKLARSEFLVWSHFFPGETFPTAKQKVADTRAAASTPVEGDRDEPSSPFPKALQNLGGRAKEEYEQAARREWVHDRYQPESPTRGSYRIKMERDSYRPVQEIDSYRPQVLGENRSAVRSGTDKPGVVSSGGNVDRTALRTMPNGSTTGVSTPVADDNKPYRSQRDVIYQKAVAAGISREEVEACLEEKAGVAEKKFAERSGDWQIFFVEASAWGRFFKSIPFPGIEPSKHQAETKMQWGPPALSPQPSPLEEYFAGASEKLMEGKTKSQGERREFFQYLQKMRTYSRLQHPTEACNHIRGWFADNLTWQHFFGPDPYPFAQPPGKPFGGCAACLLLPKFARLTGGTMKKVMGIVTAQKPVPQIQPIKDFLSGAPTAPAASRSAVNPTADNLSKGEPLQITKGVSARSASESSTAPIKFEPPVTEALTAIPRGTQQMTLNPPGAPVSRRDLRTPPPSTLARPAAEITGFHPQTVAPGRLSAQLAQMWAQDPFLGKGTVVMQNNVPVVFNKTFVGELFNCFASDTKQAIAGIGAELKCHIHYYVISTGDLFLWTEPQIPGDQRSFNCGHTFITGWVTRVSSFGMVKPSIHWNAIRTLLAPLQAQPSTIVQPRNTADALSLLANYVNAAATNKPQSVVIEKSASTEQCPWTNVAVRTTSTQKPALQRVPSPQPGLSKSTPRTPSTTMIYPSAFEDPEQQWHRYKAAFRISDIDRLMMEEAAKNEGDLRMVLDEESGQIVSVEELVKRTVYRCSLKVAKGAGTGGGVASGNGGLNGRNGGEMAVNKKRKIGDGGGGRDGDRQDGREEKRACV